MFCDLLRPRTLMTTVMKTMTIQTMTMTSIITAMKMKVENKRKRKMRKEIKKKKSEKNWLRNTKMLKWKNLRKNIWSLGTRNSKFLSLQHSLVLWNISSWTYHLISTYLLFNPIRDTKASELKNDLYHNL